MMGDRSYPEIDRVDWFTTDQARTKLNPAQGVFIERLELGLQDLTDFRKDRT
jgi:predicted NUDIX family NTP pyrophosphohydrolase